MNYETSTLITNTQTNGENAFAIMETGIVPVIFVEYGSSLWKSLWEFSPMDDCDYVLLVPRSEMVECYTDADNVHYEPSNFYIEKMLQGDHKTFWTVGTIGSVEFGIGYAYHA